MRRVQNCAPFYASILASSLTGLPLPKLGYSTPIGVDELLWYVVGQMGSMISLTGAVPSYHIL